MFLALLRTIEVTLPYGGQSSFRKILLLSIVVAALSTLRAPYFISAAFILGSIWFLRKDFRLTKTIIYALPLMTGIVLLIPWAISLWHSSGTPYFPLIKGNYNPNYGSFISKNSYYTPLQAFYETSDRGQLAGVIAVIITAFLRIKKNRDLVLSMSFLFIFMTFSMAVQLTNFPSGEIFRYLVPLEIALIIIFLPKK